PLDLCVATSVPHARPSPEDEHAAPPWFTVLVSNYCTLIIERRCRRPGIRSQRDQHLWPRTWLLRRCHGLSRRIVDLLEPGGSYESQRLEMGRRCLRHCDRRKIRPGHELSHVQGRRTDRDHSA